MQYEDKPVANWRRREANRLAQSQSREVERQARAAARELFTPAQIAEWGTWSSPLPYPSPSARPEQRHFRWSESLGEFEVIAK